MKNNLKNTAILFFVGVTMLASVSCTKEKGPVTNNPSNETITIQNLKTQINSLPYESINPEELKNLLFIREEEKLARDVYTTLYNKWGVSVFTNISGSEQTHMDAVKQLLDKYKIEDPVRSNTVGVFQNADLQKLYNELVAQGYQSPLAAYTVGATIEDLDIFDLKNALLLNDNQDIKLVYEMLSKGSRNHMRSFYKNILGAGGTYTPQFISQDEFTAIVTSPMETGF
jgi:hypothetical protein